MARNYSTNGYLQQSQQPAPGTGSLFELPRPTGPVMGPARRKRRTGLGSRFGGKQDLFQQSMAKLANTPLAPKLKVSKAPGMPGYATR